MCMFRKESLRRRHGGNKRWKGSREKGEEGRVREREMVSNDGGVLAALTEKQL